MVTFSLKPLWFLYILYCIIPIRSIFGYTHQEETRYMCVKRKQWSKHMMPVPTQTLRCQPGFPRGISDANANGSHVQGHQSAPKEIPLWDHLSGQSHAFPVTRPVPHVYVFSQSLTCQGNRWLAFSSDKEP